MTNLIFITDLIIDQACQTPMKIMHLYMNRLVIDEEQANEISGVGTYTAQIVSKEESNMGHTIWQTPYYMAYPEDFVFHTINRLPWATSVREFSKSDVSQKEITIEILSAGKLVENAIQPLLRRAKESYSICTSKKESPIHLIICGNSLTWMEIMGYDTVNDIRPNDFSEELMVYVQEVLDDLEINSIHMTFLQMWRHHLVTLETADKCFTGKTRTKDGEKMISVGDDLELFQTKLTILPKALIGQKLTYFLPKAGF